ncbi:cation diffusion facilitator family transporter [Pseudomonas protegens]|jgi:cation diffusion facilitator family transporter|uniref:Cation-efflux pump FieF n=1 Tax=Pseudomonas protegens (strain DSM 19095 / LMG 27888 / CFBP 6595 / CHA0) TaxID=1124983 RepID=A0A2C9ETX8_PSEPH|nr:cation diffusion facilitator family transporter [Pseudomonas protegens]AGL87127.1 cation-efflux pump FieF [Pseudomonas protegens CHA0]MBP5109750.1 cation diffusion facilitator family transporter [Pseudomonas protegens]QTU27448.1 cation diffusion facilitator family transporter [Pseudomonas protegens]QTU31084.1 cation diffusion facilitator family transporter [Pseudomonas protegens]RLO20845.1 cation diffusion facilitator family transporter [Pseudomonas protegens]
MTANSEHARLLRLATRASVTVAGILIATKAVAWWLSGSVSMLAGLTDSVLDGFTSLLNLLAVHYALRPADDDHRYGHGKAESLAGMAQALFIAGSAVLIAFQAAQRLQHPEPVGAPWLSIGVIVLSLALTIALLLLQHRVIRATGSNAVRADSLHYRSDLMLNGSILLALVLAAFGLHQVDAWFGLGIAVYILWSAIQIARESFSVLMDQELPPDVSQHMLELACSVPGVLGAHDLRTRISGSHWFVQLHLELPGELTLSVAHGISDQAADAIQKAYPRAEVLVHADPQEVVKAARAQ